MLTVYIFRHAEVIYPLDDQGRRIMFPPTTEISDEGRKQLISFVQFLKSKNISFSKIVTSPYTRAVQSAEIIGSTLAVPAIIKDERLRDSDVGDWMGIRLSLQQEVLDKGYDIYTPPPGYPKAAETREQITKRMKEAFDEIIKSSHEEDSIAVVSHGDPIRLLRFALEHPTEQIPPMSKLTDGFVKRGEALKIMIDDNKIQSMEIISNRNDHPGSREIYVD